MAEGAQMIYDEEKEYFADYPRLTVLPFVLWAIIIGLVIGGVLYASKAVADPVARAEADGAVITFYNEPCLIRDQISNLPFRAEWVEKGKTFQGCYGIRPDIGVLVTWFDDKTVALIPLQAVKRVFGA